MRENLALHGLMFEDPPVQEPKKAPEPPREPEPVKGSKDVKVLQGGGGKAPGQGGVRG